MHDQSQNTITYIGETNYRNGKLRFGIKEQDRFQGIYCIGKSGVGKSTLLYNMALSDLKNGKGLAVLDPHSDLAKKLIKNIPFGREKDVVIFDPMDAEYPSCFNPLENVPPEQHHLVASNLVETFKKIWADYFGPRMSYILTYCIQTLLTYPGATLLHIRPLLTDANFRAQVLMYVRDPHIMNFWAKEFDRYTPSFRNEAISPILNKVGIFHSSTALKNALGQENSDFTMQDVMDGKKILIADLGKGKLGEEPSSILGSILTTAIMNCALGRSNQREEDRVPFFLYVDECHSFVNASFAKMLSECRKYKLATFLSHQYLSQLDESTQNAVIGNIGTLISFRLGSTDAQELAKEYHPIFNANDLINIPKYSFYIKLMIDAQQSQPFSANTILNEM